jgi:hypothetical protein
MALVFLTASAVGLFVLATTLQVSAEATIEEKAGLTLGADAVLELSRSAVSEQVDPSTISAPTTQVRRAPDAVLDDGTIVDVLAIDPETFAAVAYRPRYLAEVDVDGLTARLSGVPADERDVTLPALVIGGSLGDATSVQIADAEVVVEQVGAAPLFPGTAGDNPALVIPDAGPLAPDDPGVTARLAYAVTPELWVSAAGTDLASLRETLAGLEQDYVALGTAGSATPATFEYAADLREGPGVAPATWTFTYLRAQTTVIALLGLLALVFHHVTRQRQQALGTDLASRMGLRRRARVVTETIEIAALTGLALLLGAAAGGVAARTVVASYDPVPDVALPVVFRVPLEVLSPPVAVLLVTVVAAVAITIRAVDRIDVATVLRSGS